MAPVRRPGILASVAGAVDRLVGKNPRLQHGAGWNHRNRLTQPATEVV